MYSMHDMYVTMLIDMQTGICTNACNLTCSELPLVVTSLTLVSTSTHIMHVLQKLVST